MNKKTLSLLVGVIIALAVGFLVKTYAFGPSQKDKLIKAANELNESCPMDIDADTRLDHAICVGENGFMYDYTLVNFVTDSMDVPAFKKLLRPMIVNSVKTNPEMQGMRDEKVTMFYNYKDKNGKFITKLEITSADYQ